MTRATALAAVRATAQRIARPARKSAGELLTTLVLVVGWLLVTDGVARLTSPVAWDFSLGLLALSLGGWKLLATVAWHGLYALTAEEKRNG